VSRWLRLAAVIVVAAGADAAQRDAPGRPHRTDVTYGIYEDNDPAKRLMVVANYDNDVPEYWEWSGEGLFPFDASNEAYKLGVNYVLYGLTH